MWLLPSLRSVGACVWPWLPERVVVVHIPCVLTYFLTYLLTYLLTYDVLEGLAPEDSGGFFAYDGSDIPW